MNDDPVSVPPLPLKIVTAALIALFVVLPTGRVILQSDFASVPLMVAGGLSFVGLILGLMFLHRIILWIHYRFYWYIMAAFYTLLAVTAAIFFRPLFTPLQIGGLSSMSLVGQSLLIPGAIVGIVAIVLAFRHGRLPSPVDTEQPTTLTPPAPTPTPAPNPQKHILDTAQQIASRKKGLGLDDDGSK